MLAGDGLSLTGDGLSLTGPLPGSGDRECRVTPFPSSKPGEPGNRRPGEPVRQRGRTVANAAANSPVLSTLAAALSGGLNPHVNLVNTLNGGQFTVFAPTNDAFAKLDPATVEKLKTDSTLLSSILTYHVVAGQAGPDQVVGTHKTVNGATVTVSGMGDNLKVNDANVVCGGIPTTNATVYLIDTVLVPPAS